LMASRRYL